MRTILAQTIRTVSTSLVALALAGSAHAVTYTVSGTLSGLATGETVTVTLNGKDPSTLSKNAKFQFTQGLASGASYTVAVGKQPLTQICTVTDPTGVIDKANVSGIQVKCVNAYSIGGTITGIAPKEKMTLVDNGTDIYTFEALTSSSKGFSYTFKTLIAKGGTYDVTVGTPPLDQVCTVANAKGTVGTANVTNVNVTCKAGFTVGGKVTDLWKGQTLVLANEGGNLLTIPGSSTPTLSVSQSFTFTDALANLAAYDVTVKTQPASETCTVTGASGHISSKNVATVAIACKPNPYTIGGVINDLDKTGKLELLDNGGNALNVVGTGSQIKFHFTDAVASGSKYDVTVAGQPVGQVCTVADGTGTVGSAAVNTVVVTCALGYTVGGKVTGLPSTQSVTLTDNGGDATVVKGDLSGSSGFVFPTALAKNSAWNVAIKTQPSAFTCKVTADATGTKISANVIGVVVTCTPDTYSVSGTVAFNGGGGGVTLELNGANPETITSATAGTAPFIWTGKVAKGGTYAVTESNPTPAGETCSVANGSGIGVSANVTNVKVTCSAPATTYPISVTISGLNGSITLGNSSDSDSLNALADGTFTFTKRETVNSPYNISVTSQPVGQTCTAGSVSNPASGTVTAAVNVPVACTTNNYNISVTISGLTSGSVVLGNSSDSDSLTETANGTFNFPKQEAYGSPFDVGVTTQPAGETCTAGNGGSPASGTVTGAVNVPVSCVANATYTISVTISGLSGSVTLANSSDSDSLTETSNGTFNFAKKEASGAQYNIAVTSQPSGQTCTPGSVQVPASGSVSGAVDVPVACAANTTGGGGGSYWIPITANPLSGASDGTTGMAIFPSNKIATNPTPALDWVTTTPTQVLALSLNITFSAGVLTDYAPDQLMYAATGSDKMIHIYGLPVGDTSSVPTPTQIGNLSLDPTKFQVCSSASQAQTSLTDPTSMFVVIYVAAATTEMNPIPCDVSGGTYEVVHYTDSSSTAPVVVSIHPFEGIDPLYSDGSLVGLMLLDSTSNNIVLYADDTFTSPTTLISDVSLYTLAGIYIKDGSNFGTSNDFVSVTGTSSNSGLYLVKPGSTTASLIHAGTIGSTSQDDNNVYFADVSSTTATKIYQVANTGGTPMLIYSGPATVTAGMPAVVFPLEYDLMGSNDTVLIFSTFLLPSTASPLTAVPQAAMIYEIPDGTLSTSLTTIGGPYTGEISGILAASKPNDLAHSVLFANITTVTGSFPSQTITYSSVAIPPAGPFTQTPLPNSVYSGFGSYADQLSGAVFRVKGINPSAGGWGGANFYQVDVGTLAETVLTLPGGGDYAIPTTPTGADYVGTLAGFLTDNTAEGILLGINDETFETTPSIGLAADTSKNVMIQFAITDTNVLVSF